MTFPIDDQYLTPYLTQIDGPKFRFNGKIYDRYKFLASWEKIKSHVIQHYVQHISHEPWPGYNEVARKMERWYHYDARDGTGLGRQTRTRHHIANRPRPHRLRT
eukprot:scaffold5535_cov135-Isochrysis_galbana.AAC.1